MRRVDELLYRWRDDSLTPAEVEELASLLEAPENRRALVEEFCLAQTASEALTGTEGLLATLEPAGMEVGREGEEPVTRRRPSPGASRHLPSPPSLPAPRSGNRSKKTRWLLALAACLLLAIGAAGWFAFSTPKQEIVTPVARVVEVSGQVEVLTPSGDIVSASPGLDLYAGQTLRTGDDSFAVVEYPDSTRLELHADTIVRLTEPRCVIFSTGFVRADVPPRQSGAMVLSAPQATIRSSDSRLSLASAGTQTTRIDVEEGNAELTRQTDGRVVPMNGGSYVLATMDVEPPVVQALVAPLTKPVRSIEFRQARGAAYGEGNDLRLAWSRWLRVVENGQPRQHALLAGKRANDGQVAFARRGQVVAVSSGTQLGVWDLDPLRPRQQWTPPLAVNVLALSEDGQRLITLDVKKATVSVHDATDGTEKHRLIVGVRASRGLAVSADGKTLAVGCLPRPRGEWTVRLFDADNGKALTQLGGHETAPRLLCFSADDKLLASAGNDGVVKLYDVQTGGLLHRIASHERPLTSLCFSPDAKTLAGGSGDGKVFLWQTDSGQQWRSIKAGQRAVLALAFSADGTRLATCGQAMPVQEWDLTTP